MIFNFFRKKVNLEEILIHKLSRFESKADKIENILTEILRELKRR